jgi:hypothetical protein
MIARPLSFGFFAAPFVVAAVPAVQRGDWRMLGVAACAFCGSVAVVVAARSGVIRTAAVPLATLVAATLVGALPRLLLYGGSTVAVLTVAATFAVSLSIAAWLYVRT